MSAGEQKSSTLATASHAALCLAGVNTLAARARADLRNREEAEELLAKGDEHETRGEWIKARECFERGLFLDPNNGKLQYSFGAMLGVNADGEVDPSFDPLAYLWMLKSAEQGYMWAQSWLWCFREDYLIDHAQATVWLHRAGEQGHRDSAWALSGIYLRGDGVPQSDLEASFWVELYASLLERDGYGPRSDDEERRQYLSSKLSPEELAAINQRVAGWFSDHPLRNQE
jgi:TPR repeat protein